MDSEKAMDALRLVRSAKDMPPQARAPKAAFFVTYHR
jgi:hypothetical protein